ncbi:MAG: hypothetical protein JWN34_2850 [Bryobacterales bacterium]|nr:hypothetical protein [Bryobacterales bacterium]
MLASVVASFPQPPARLPAEARAFWQSIVMECIASGVALIRSDALSLELFACTAARLKACLEAGAGVESTETREIVMEFCSDFMLSPGSVKHLRAEIGLTQPAEIH